MTKFKLSLPFSIQQIIELCHNLNSNQTVIDLKFKDIEQDLKYQYNKYEGNKAELKKIYCNYDAEHKQHWEYYHETSKSYEKRYDMILNAFTPTHYLLKQLYLSNLKTLNLSIKCKIKLVKQIIKFIKLLIINDIIDINWVINMG